MSPHEQQARGAPLVGGVAVAGELYAVEIATLRDSLLPAEPPEVKLGVIELSNGTPSFAVVLRRQYRRTSTLTDIADIGSWRACQSFELPA